MHVGISEGDTTLLYTMKSTLSKNLSSIIHHTSTLVFALFFLILFNVW